MQPFVKFYHLLAGHVVIIAVYIQYVGTWHIRPLGVVYVCIQARQKCRLIVLSIFFVVEEIIRLFYLLASACKVYTDVLFQYFKNIQTTYC